MYSYVFIRIMSAHTQESAKALADTISMACQGSKLVAVVAMASDKDHVGFAKELLSGYSLISMADRFQT